MDVEIIFDKLKFDKHPEKSTTQNWAWNDKRCMVKFVGLPETLKAKDFLWMPSYEQLEMIHEAVCWSEFMAKKKHKEFLERKKEKVTNDVWELDL